MTKTILVVDDSEIIRFYVADALVRAGFSVVEAVDGEDALSKLDSKNIDLIISDLDMPKMGGIEFVKTLRQLPVHQKIPVIIHSMCSHEIEKRADSKLDIKAWLNKPTTPDQLLAEVRQLC